MDMSSQGPVKYIMNNRELFFILISVLDSRKNHGLLLIMASFMHNREPRKQVFDKYLLIKDEVAALISSAFPDFFYFVTVLFACFLHKGDPW